MLFLALYRLFKTTKQLSFDSLAETDVVRRSPTYFKVFVSAQAGIEPDLPYGKSTLYSLSHRGSIYILFWEYLDEGYFGAISVLYRCETRSRVKDQT